MYKISLVQVFFEENLHKLFLLQEWLQDLQLIAPNVSVGKLDQLLSTAFALISRESTTIGLPDFPIDNVILAAKILVSKYFLFENYFCEY